MRFARPVYGAAGWGVVILGVVHMLATTRLPLGRGASAVWFCGSGLAMVLAGTLNLLNRSYGLGAAGLRRVCVASNLAMTAFALVAGVVTNAGTLQFAIILGLTGGAAMLSFLPHAIRPR